MKSIATDQLTQHLHFRQADRKPDDSVKGETEGDNSALITHVKEVCSLLVSVIVIVL